jgi:oligopeptide/dipeptide ABC transporter ATP-binding protein
VVAENANRVIVMYAGRKVEEADVDDLFERPAHPYTQGLLASLPHLPGGAQTSFGQTRLNEIKGMVPSLTDLPPGCSFAPRCKQATERCLAAFPPLQQHWPGHWVACWHVASRPGAE